MNIQHTQLFLTFTEEGSAACGGAPSGNDALSKQISQISKKLDKISANLGGHRAENSGNTCNREVQMYRELVHALERENRDVKELLELQSVLAT